MNKIITSFKPLYKGDNMIYSQILRASEIQGHQVMSNQNEVLGEIIETVIDTQSNYLIYYVISFGGLFGLGEKFFAFPPEAIKYNVNEGKFLLDVDKETLKEANGFDKNNWPIMDGSDFRESVYSTYGYEFRTPIV